MGTKGEDTRELILATTQDLVLERGFAGTSIDDILHATGLSKGAFFYHYKNKAELGAALMARYAAHDLALFTQLSTRADELSDDPLQSTLIFLKLFEEFIEGLDGPHRGCLFAAYVYEQENFAPSVARLVVEGFKEWKKIYRDRFERVQERYPSSSSITSDDLSDLIMSIIQGSLVLAKSSADKGVIIRNVRSFRLYFQLLFSKSHD